MIYVIVLVVFIGGDLAGIKAIPFESLSACEKAGAELQATAKTDKDVDLWTKCEAVPMPKGKPAAPKQGENN
jgi:hypothetical protein